MWYEEGKRRPCQSVTEEGLAAKLEKLTVRLAADAPGMEGPGAGLIAFLPVTGPAPGQRAELARRAFVTPQSMNKFLHDLEKQQLVVRRPHPRHGRVLQASLTPEGRRVAAAASAAVDTVERRMLTSLSPEAQDKLAKALSSCIHALTQPPA